MARVIENWAFAMSPLVLAVGSQADADLWAASGEAAAMPIESATAKLFTILLI